MDLEKIEQLSDFIGKLRKEKGFTIEKLSNELHISPQGLHNWIYKRKDVNWKIQSLIELSRILEFELTISKGILNVKEINKMENENEMVLNEIYRDYGDMFIRILYTPNSNISDDVEPSLIEDWLYYYSADDCEFEHQENSKVQIFGLFQKLENGEVEIKGVSIRPYNLETLYYLNFAPVVDITSDNYEVVSIDNKNGIKIARAYADLNIVSGKAFLKGYSNADNQSSILGLALMNIKGTSSDDFINWYENMEWLYEETRIENFIYRYFDKRRNEIFEGDTLEMVGLDDIYDDSDFEDFDADSDFSIGDKITVEKQGGRLFYLKGHRDEPVALENLNLLKWEIVNF